MRALAILVLLISCFLSMADEAEDALNDARRFAAEGKYEEALERHIWFHNHSLEVSPSYRGVRLSFALSDWVQLGAKYSRALEALKETRDKKVARLLSGGMERDLFQEVVSINAYLKESSATVELFKQIEAANPGFAASVYDLAAEALVTAKEYDLAKRYLGDPMAHFAKAKRIFDGRMQYAQTSPATDASRQAFEKLFTDEVVRIMVVLDETGDHEAAQKVQSEALQVLDSSKIRGALGAGTTEPGAAPEPPPAAAAPEQSDNVNTKPDTEAPLDGGGR